ncbi:MAG: RecQ family ATP-dependent DNA helicase [Ktedonobacteraceae bacterium]
MVDIEATGPLRFLNQQDPLVAAHMRLYDRLYRKEKKHPFDSFLLPQALLELKARLSSPARIHVILDSGLRDKVYWEEVKTLFEQDTILDTLPGMADTTQIENGAFSSVLERALESNGLHLHVQVDDETLHQTLQTFWQIDSFREAPLNQKEIVQAILNHQSPPEDQLVIAATGGGKSLCYQLPAILLAQGTIPKVTLVISPLIALMNDQVAALRKNGVFAAIAWNSTTPDPDRRNYLEGIKRGWYSLIYAAPEQIHFSALRAALQAREIGLIAIDEAHCVSQWGHNFRTEYFALKNWIETQLCTGQREFPIIALTATARNGYKGEQGTVQDIIGGLGLHLQENQVRLTSPERPELDYSVEPIIMHCLHCHTSLGVKAGVVICPTCNQSRNIDAKAVEETKIEKLISLLADNSEHGLRQRWNRPFGLRQRGLIYCTYAKSKEHMTVEGVAEILRADPRLTGLRIGAYHAQMPNRNEALKKVYSAFTNNDENGVDVVVATNAFGMGIDVRRLGFVIHFDTPGTLEAYIQEAGRAGRDAEFRDGGEPARCILLYHEHDLDNQSNLSNLSKVTEQQIVNVYELLSKCRKQGEQEIFVTADEIKRLAGLKDKEKDKINSALYYLEYHTFAHAKPVLARGENAPIEWLLALEHGYEDRIKTVALSVLSQQLINKLSQMSVEFCLRERAVRVVDSEALADSLGWERKTVIREIHNLVKIHILVRTQHLSIRWLKSRSETYQFTRLLNQDIKNLLASVPDQHPDKRISVNIEALYDEKRSTAMPLQTFTNFLFALSNGNKNQFDSNNSLCIFQYFRPEYALGHDAGCRNPHADGEYGLQRWWGTGKSDLSQWANRHHEL